MAHNKVYGICESKCKVEVYAKSTMDTKLEKVNTKIANETSNRQTAVEKVSTRVAALEEWKYEHNKEYDNLDSALTTTNQNVDTLFSQSVDHETRIKALEDAMTVLTAGVTALEG